jgi:hypothetical protein
MFYEVDIMAKFSTLLVIDVKLQKKIISKRGPRPKFHIYLEGILNFYFSSNCDIFLAHLAKGNVSFCHHLASVIR